MPYICNAMWIPQANPNLKSDPKLSFATPELLCLSCESHLLLYTNHIPQSLCLSSHGKAALVHRKFNLIKSVGIDYWHEVATVESLLRNLESYSKFMMNSVINDIHASGWVYNLVDVRDFHKHCCKLPAESNATIPTGVLFPCCPGDHCARAAIPPVKIFSREEISSWRKE